MPPREPGFAADRLAHDAAWACATSIMDCVEHCFPEEARPDAFAAIYERVKIAIEVSFLHADRRQQRLGASDN